MIFSKIAKLVANKRDYNINKTLNKHCQLDNIYSSTAQSRKHSSLTPLSSPQRPQYGLILEKDIFYTLIKIN